MAPLTRSYSMQVSLPATSLVVGRRNRGAVCPKAKAQRAAQTSCARLALRSCGL